MKWERWAGGGKWEEGDNLEKEGEGEAGQCRSSRSGEGEGFFEPFDSPETGRISQFTGSNGSTLVQRLSVSNSRTESDW